MINKNNAVLNLTSSRSVGMRDINALLTAPISRISSRPQSRDDEGRKDKENVGQTRTDSNVFPSSLAEEGACVSTGERGCLFSSPHAGEVARSTDGGSCVSNTPLPRCAVLSPQGGQKTARGFTLIELLVVILIIGILAAIAVPQYQKAITKSRAMKMVNLLRAHIPVWENFYLEHGRNPSSFSELGLQLPADWTDTTKLYLTAGPANKEMAIAYQPALQAVQIGFISGPYKGAGFAYMFVPRNGGGGNYGTIPAKEIVCSEYRLSDVPFTRKKGDFCEKIFRGNKIYDSGMDVYFRIAR